MHMTPRLLPWVALLLCGFVPWAEASKPEILVDRIAAVVGGELIFASDVELEARLALVKKGYEQGLDAPIDDALRARILDELLIIELTFAEARRLRLLDDPETEAARLRDAKERLDIDCGRLLATVLARFDVDEEELGAYLRKRYYASRLLDERLGTAPTREEVEAFYRTHPELFNGRPLEEVFETASLLAKKDLIRERLLRYLDELRSRFPVRVLLPAARTP